MNKTYSICVANWNSMNTVQRWASSLLTNLATEDEVVIVDGRSSDGSQEFLSHLCRERGFTFASAKAHVGRQRQRAFELATGEYVIAHVDTDDVVVSLQEAKRLYHEAVEWDPVSGKQRAFRCWGFFIIPRWMLEAVGGYPDLRYYEDQLVSYRLASQGQLTLSVKVAAATIGVDPKKARLGVRVRYSFRRIREGLRLGMFETRNPQGFLLLPLAWLASLLLPHYGFRKDWWNLDTGRDEYILAWIDRQGLSEKLLHEKIEHPQAAGTLA